MAKRIALSLDEDQVKILHSIKGLGKKDAEIIKNILLLYFHEQELLGKKKGEKK